MKLAMLALCAVAAGCDGGGSGPGGDGAPGGGDDRPWTGTATVRSTDPNGNGETITAQVTWVVMAHDADGTDYAPSGTVTIARTQTACTVAIAPAQHGIGASDGFLRVDAGSYRGAGGTFWDVTVTTTCPPDAPLSLPTTIAPSWWSAPAPRALTAADRIEGHEAMGLFTYDWSFVR